MKASHPNNRRGFLRKILTLTASAGVVGLLLDRLPARSALPPVQADGTPMNIGVANSGTASTSITAPGAPAAFHATASGSAAGLQGDCTAGTGVLGNSTTGTGVQGTASSSGGTALSGFVSDPGAIPIVAQGAASQTANLQEWRNGSGAVGAVNATGNFGIGTANPQFQLHLVGGNAYQLYVKAASGQTSQIIVDTTGSGNQCAFAFFDQGAGKWQFGKQSDNSFFMYDSANNREFLAVDPARKIIGLDPSFLPYKVGIGTYSPSFPLDVAGQVHATGFPTSSDTRFKEDITPIDNALEKILSLNGVYFKWNHLHRDVLKRSNTKARQVGLIAQQVKQVIPEIVTEWADKGAKDYLAVDYNRLVAVIIQAMKEQQTTIQQLSTRIESLEQTVGNRKAS